MISTLKWFNVGLRAVIELGIVVALSYWGYAMGNNAGEKILFAVSAPLIGFGFWGLVDFHRAGSLGEPLRLIQELIISGFAALAWVAAGAQSLGWMLGLVSIVHHILVYASGETLLKH